MIRIETSCPSRVARAGAVAFLAIPLALAGCGSGDPFTRIESTFDRTVGTVCSRCPAATGTTTEADCRAAAAAGNPFTGASWDCQRMAYGQYTSELAPTYDCVARAVSSFETCMSNAVGTCPPASATVEACTNQVDTAIEACPQTDSIMAAQAVSACFSD